MEVEVPKKRSYTKWGIGGLVSLIAGGVVYGPIDKFVTRAEANSLEQRSARIEQKVDAVPEMINKSKDEIITMIRRSYDHTQDNIKETEHRMQRDVDRSDKRLDALEAALFLRSKRDRN